jgi:hypothetical protein
MILSKESVCCRVWNCITIQGDIQNSSQPLDLAVFSGLGHMDKDTSLLAGLLLFPAMTTVLGSQKSPNSTGCVFLLILFNAKSPIKLGG